MKRAVAAALLFAAFLALGAWVSSHPPSALDRSELGFFGSGVAVATFCRAAGLFPPYAAMCALALVAGLIRRTYLPAALWLIALMLVVWKISDAFKELFHRVRPDHWLLMHETTAGYASGHAALSLAFYGFVAYVAWRSRLSSGARGAILAVAVTCILAIGWSRLALGAHYPSDVIGGYLLGGAALCCATLGYDRPRGRGFDRIPVRTRSRYTR